MKRSIEIQPHETNLSQKIPKAVLTQFESNKDNEMKTDKAAFHARNAQTLKAIPPFMWARSKAWQSIRNHEPDVVLKVDRPGTTIGDSDGTHCFKKEDIGHHVDVLLPMLPGSSCVAYAFNIVSINGDREAEVRWNKAVISKDAPGKSGSVKRFAEAYEEKRFFMTPGGLIAINGATNVEKNEKLEDVEHDALAEIRCSFAWFFSTSAKWWASEWRSARPLSVFNAYGLSEIA
jgi:hypothetical protein